MRPRAHEVGHVRPRIGEQHVLDERKRGGGALDVGQNRLDHGFRSSSPLAQILDLGMGCLVAGPDYGGFSMWRQPGSGPPAVYDRHRVKSRTSVATPLTRTKRADIRLLPVVVVRRPWACCLRFDARGLDREGAKDSMSAILRQLRWIVLGVAALLAACVTSGGGEPAAVEEKPAASAGSDAITTTRSRVSTARCTPLTTR